MGRVGWGEGGLEGIACERGGVGLGGCVGECREGVTKCEDLVERWIALRKMCLVVIVMSKK